MNISRALNCALLLCTLLAIGEAAISSSFRERAKTYCREYDLPWFCSFLNKNVSLITNDDDILNWNGSIGLAKKCKLKEVNRYDYDLMKISDFPGMQPIGYLVRLPLYVLAPRDAHIVFSPMEKPVWTRDSVYEIRKLEHPPNYYWLTIFVIIYQCWKWVFLFNEVTFDFPFKLLAVGVTIGKWFY